jgi:hypothetical protein
MGGLCSTQEGDETSVDNFNLEIHREDNMEEIRVDGRIISRWILNGICSEEVIKVTNESSFSVNGKYKLFVNYVINIVGEKLGMTNRNGLLVSVT